ncbi:AAA family ATPase [Brevibacillus ruminantium]|uniref:AAA family ATPase n=1 Tax=Brevibacillus ruminantium TaxID=2950604 RepID=A0ABY4WB14_9BACL|nr:AAA family ATPase [Brevibacillus ruminantium]USG64371.1 AAA family ATPase [Brevibacillus ruminantium]
MTSRLFAGEDGAVGGHFQLFGSLKVSFDDVEVTTVISAGKVRLLLAYLVLNLDMPQSRRKLAFDFWPDSTDKQALSNLRKLLHDLRECLPQLDQYLHVTPAYIQWKQEQPIYSDVRAFEQAAKGTTLHELRIAEELYKGELLPGFYEEWLSAKREWLAQTYASVLEKLVSILEGKREYISAISYAKKLLAQNHLGEETYRTLMRLYALNNDTVNVVKMYRQLCTTLHDELGIEPAEETTLLFERLTQKGGESQAAVYRQASHVNSPTPLIGRIEEWGKLVRVWKQVTDGRKTLLIVKGEAGIGKTRLSLECKAWVESQGGYTAFAGCFPSVRSLAFTPVTAWLRSLPMPPLSLAVLSELSRLLPELSERYPDLPQPTAIQENWQVIRWYDAIEQMLLAMQPLLLILDDIQWSDRETLQLLSYLLRSDSKAKLFVIATMRTDEDPDDAVGSFFAGLRIERRLTEMELAPLTEDETKRLMAASVGDALANRHSSGLYAKTGGNPLFIVETLRETRTFSEKSEIDLSPLVRTVIENRFNQLSPDNRRLASTIAAIGRPVSPALLALILDRKEETILERLEQLIQRKVLQEDENGQFNFTHDLVKETAYKLTNESRRSQSHRQIAGGLLAFHREQPEMVAAEIAFHYERAGAEKEAITYYKMAASAAEKLYANETRIKYYEKLCMLLHPEETLPILMKLGDALILVGDWSGAEKTYRQWLDRFGYAITFKERALCDVALGNCLRLQGKYEEARFHLERALHHFMLMEEQAGLGYVYGALGILHYYMGNYDKSLHYLMARLELPDDENRARDDCRFFAFIGFLFYDQCEYEQAVHWFKRQIGRATECRDEYSIGEALGGLALVYLETDDMDLAFDNIVEKMNISKSIGNRMGFAMALGMLGKYYHLQGWGEQAEPCIAFCLEEAVLIRDWHIAAVVLGIEGCILMDQHRYEEAELMIGRSIRLAEQTRIPFFECEGLYFRSLLRQRENQAQSAVEAAAEALEIANRLKRREMQVLLLSQLSHLKVELGWVSPGVAMRQLQKMLKQYSGQREQAAIRLAMWKLQPNSPERRTAALLLNEELYRKSGKQEYLSRCRVMNGPAQAAPARPLPPLAALATQNKRITPNILSEIERYLDSSN